MGDVVKKLNLPKPDGFLYFVENDGSVWKHEGGSRKLISNSKFNREEGYLYFIDLDGNLARKPNIQQRDKDTNKVLKPGTQILQD